MRLHVMSRCAIVIIGAGLVACSSMKSASSVTSAFDKLGGTKGVTSMASELVSSSLKDPRLAGLTRGKNIDQAAASGKVSDQLCSMLGGGCTAPLTDSQLASGAKKLSPDESKAI